MALFKSKTIITNMKHLLLSLTTIISLSSIAQQPEQKSLAKYKVILDEGQWNAFFSIIARLKNNAGNPDLTTEQLKYLRNDADSVHSIFFNQVKPQYDSAHAEPVKTDTIKKHK